MIEFYHQQSVLLIELFREVSVHDFKIFANFEVLKFLKYTQSMHFNWENKVLVNIKEISPDIESKIIKN